MSDCDDVCRQQSEISKMTDTASWPEYNISCLWGRDATIWYTSMTGWKSMGIHVDDSRWLMKFIWLSDIEKNVRQKAGMVYIKMSNTRRQIARQSNELPDLAYLNSQDSWGKDINDDYFEIQQQILRVCKVADCRESNWQVVTSAPRSRKKPHYNQVLIAGHLSQIWAW